MVRPVHGLRLLTRRLDLHRESTEELVGTSASGGATPLASCSAGVKVIVGESLKPTLAPAVPAAAIPPPTDVPIYSANS